MSKSSAPIPEVSGPILDIAKYVAVNNPVWVATDTTPKKGEPPKNVSVASIVGGTLIVEEDTQQLVTGHSFSYRLSPVIGVTPVGSNPLLFGNMAPDQYNLPEPVPLTEEIIKEIIKFAQSKVPSLTEEQIKEVLKGVQIQDSTHTAVEIEDKLKSLGVEIREVDKRKIAKPIQAFVGRHHIDLVAEMIGRGEPKQYAVLTITGIKQGETKGFDLDKGSEIPGGRSKHQVDEENELGQKSSTVVKYNGHNKNIAQQMVVQSTAKFNDKNGKINITGSDFDQFISFYQSTIAKGVPVAVNCTDGVDRTGIVMTGLQMLHKYNQEIKKGEDFTTKSREEQQKELIKIIDELRRDRGPNFLKGTEDVAVAVTLGYTLIATQKQIDFQKKNQAELSALIQNYEGFEPDELQTEIQRKLKEKNLSSSDKKLLNEWQGNVSQRISANEQFAVANANKSTFHQEMIKVGTVKKSEARGKDELAGTFLIENAPISEYNRLLTSKIQDIYTKTNEQFDIAAFKKNGKSIFNFAAQTLMKDPSADNLQQMTQLISNAGMHKNLALNAIKAEFLTMSTQQRKDLLDQIANVEKSDNSKILKELVKVIPSEEQIKISEQLSTAGRILTDEQTLYRASFYNDFIGISKKLDSLLTQYENKPSKQKLNEILKFLAKNEDRISSQPIGLDTEKYSKYFSQSVFSRIKTNEIDQLELISKFLDVESNQGYKGYLSHLLESYQDAIVDKIAKDNPEAGKQEEELRQHFFSLMAKAKQADFLDPEKSQNVVNLANAYSRFPSLIENEILLAKNDHDRVEVYQKYCGILAHAIKKNDVGLVSSIYEALDRTYISQLKLNEKVTNKSEINSLLSKAKRIADPTNNSKYQRSILDSQTKSGNAVVPNIAIFLKDFTFAYDGNLDDNFHLKPEGAAKIGEIYSQFNAINSNVAKAYQSFDATSNLVKNIYDTVLVFDDLTGSDRLKELVSTKKQAKVKVAPTETHFEKRVENNIKSLNATIAVASRLIDQVKALQTNIDSKQITSESLAQITNMGIAGEQIGSLKTAIKKLETSLTEMRSYIDKNKNSPDIKVLEDLHKNSSIILQESYQKMDALIAAKSQLGNLKKIAKDIDPATLSAPSVTSPTTVAKPIPEANPEQIISKEEAQKSTTAPLETLPQNSSAAIRGSNVAPSTDKPAVKSETKSKVSGFSKLREMMFKKSEISPESPLQPPTTKSKSSNLPEQNISSPDSIAALKSAANIFSKYPSKENLDKMIGLQKTILSSRSSTQSMVDVLDELGMNIAPSISEEITKALKSELKNMGSKQRAAAHRLLKETAGDKSYKNDKNILRTMDKSLPSKKTSRKNDEIISKNDEVTRARLKKTYVDNVVAKLNKDYENYKLNKLDPAQAQEFRQTLAVYSNIKDDLNSEIRATAIAIRTEINSRSEKKESVKTQVELSSPPPSATPSSPLSDTPELEELKKQLIKGLTSIAAATSEDKQIINYYISQFEDKINLSAVNKYVDELRDHLKYNTNHKDYRENKFLRSNHLQPIHQQVQNEIKKFKDAVVVAENKMKSPIVSAQSEDEKAWEGVEVDLDNPNQKLPSGVPIQTVPVIASAASHPQDHSLPSTPKGGRPPSVVFNHVHPDPVNVSTPSVRRQLPVPSAEQVVKAICAQLNANKQESALPVQWNGIIKRVEEHANNDGLSASEKLGEIKKYLEDNIVNSSRPVPPNIKSKITEMIQKLPIEAVLKAADDDKKTKLRK